MTEEPTVRKNLLRVPEHRPGQWVMRLMLDPDLQLPLPRSRWQLHPEFDWRFLVSQIFLSRVPLVH